MHYKKRKLHKLHSIPIGLCNNHKRLNLVSYSIPLSCMVVLLLTGIFAINPSLSLKTSAVTIQDEWVVKDKDSESITTQGADDGIETSEVNDVPTGELDGIEEPMSQDVSENTANEYDIMPLVNASIVFSIGGAGQNETISAVPGAVAYREHTVTIDISNADEYTLLISGNSEIASDNNNAAKLVGMASVATGANIPAGQWGYGWDYTGNASKENMTYRAVPSTRTEITTPKIDSSTNTVSFTGKLAFAGKFPEDAALGNYTGGTATLTLVVSPKGNTGGALWKKADGSDSNYSSGINTMQEINTVTRDGGFCKNNSIIQTGWTIELQDNRGLNPVEKYKIVKLRDGNCWMQENLRLNLTKNMTIQGSTSSGAAFSWTVPNQDSATTQTSSASTWTSDDAAVMSRTGATEYGNYYTWCAATAGTCSGAISDGAVASASICPKGWKLPTGNTNGDFYNLFGASGVNLGDTAQKRFDAVKDSPYYFPAASYVRNGDGLAVGDEGFYWSSTARSVNRAYDLSFVSGNFNPGTHQLYRSAGFPVRCIATY